MKTIAQMNERIEKLETLIREDKAYYCDDFIMEDYIDYYLEIEELKHNVRLAWAEDEQESNYRQEIYNTDFLYMED